MSQNAMTITVKFQNNEFFASASINCPNTTLPPIKTPDGARPDGVHDKGTVLFYKIYKDIGFDSMKKVIRCFTDLENKNTYEYLNALRKNGFSHVADVIKENLEK